MKTKLFTLLSASLIFTVLALTMISATITLSNAELSIGNGSISETITVSSNQNETVSFSIDSVSDGSKTITFSPIDSIELNGTSETITLTYNIPNGFDFDLETTYTTTLTADGNVSNDTVKEYAFTQSFCSLGSQGKIEIDVDDEEEDNEDSWEWMALDDIRITVNIDNKWSEDFDGVIEYGLWDVDEKEFVYDDEMDFDVDEDEDEDFEIEFTIDPSDLDADSDNYIFYLKAYDDDEADEETMCAQISEEITLMQNKHEIKIDTDSIKSLSENIKAGDKVSVEFELFNVGTKDQDDVSVTISNTELGVSAEKMVGDIDAGDSEKVILDFTMPEDAEEKEYKFSLKIYDEDEDIYELEDHDGDDYDAVYLHKIIVTEGGSSNTGTVIVTASLEGTANAGSDVVVKATIQNTASTTQTFNLNIAGYGSWASEATVTPAVVAIQAGASQDVTVTLKANADAEGTTKFNIEVLSGSKFVLSQPVSVPVEESGLNLGSDWYLWLIGVFNVLLITAIIIVVVRILRK